LVLVKANSFYRVSVIFCQPFARVKKAYERLFSVALFFEIYQRFRACKVNKPNLKWFDAI